MRLMADNGTRTGVTELLVGVPFPPLAFEIMRYVTAPQFFPAIIFSGATFPPADALTRGLIDEIVPADALMDRAVAAARDDWRRYRRRPSRSRSGRMRQVVAERTANNDGSYGAAVTEVWAAQASHDFIRAYVARTLKK